MTTNVSCRNLADVEDVLCRLARDTFGALSLLGSTSLGQLGGDDIARERVCARRDTWHAYVLDARQFLIAAGEGEAIGGLLDQLLSAVDQLATAFADLVSADALPPHALAELRGRFPAVYRRLESALSDLGNALGIDLSFPRRLNTLRQTCFQRSLQWIDAELNRDARVRNGANGTGSHPRTDS